MDNNAKFQKEINTIFSYLAKLQEDFNDIDNINFITSIDEYRDDVVAFAQIIQQIDMENNNDR